MRRGIGFLIILLALAGCVTEEKKTTGLIDQDPGPEAKPDKIRANIEKIGTDLPMAEMQTPLNELARAGKHAEPYLFDALGDANPRRRANVIWVLRYSSNPAVSGKLAPLLKDPVFEVALEAASVMAEKGRKDGIPILIKALRHENQSIRGGAIRILQSVTKVYFGYHAGDPKDRREFSIKKWEAWWLEKGPTFRLASAGR
ncbi:MAG: HEAT repeat domain-containing protein [Planctomycetota bacterium]|jgi:HEAT repeat protein